MNAPNVTLHLSILVRGLFEMCGEMSKKVFGGISWDCACTC